MTKLQEIQKATYAEMLDCLDKHGMCNVVRPTGFGKTKMFMDYTMDNLSKQFLYVYDMSSTLNDISAHYNTINVRFVSYAMLSRLSGFDENIRMLTDSNLFCIIFDESHLMGGENIQKLLLKALPICQMKGIKVLGGTATPTRSDMVYVPSRFFGNHVLSTYTLLDAINDGIILEPYWTAMVHISKLTEDLRKYDNPYLHNRLRQLDAAYATRVGAPIIYHDAVVDVYGEVPDHMKFIVFYPTIQALKDNEDEVVADFSEAFPEHKIHIFAVSSDPEHYDDATVADSLSDVKGKHIVLLFAVEMLTQAYHADDMTGIVMNRVTFSNIVFTQQLGRCLSVTAKHRAIVFDNVGNAKINPLDAINIMQESGGIPANKLTRGHIDLTLHVKPEIMKVITWYSRILTTLSVTQEDVDMAKRTYLRDEAPAEFCEKAYGVPPWLLEEELGDEWQG